MYDIKYYGGQKAAAAFFLLLPLVLSCRRKWQKRPACWREGGHVAAAQAAAAAFTTLPLPPCPITPSSPPAVRDHRRAHLPGGSIKLAKGAYEVAAKDEALEASAERPCSRGAYGPGWLRGGKKKKYALGRGLRKPAGLGALKEGHAPPATMVAWGPLPPTCLHTTHLPDVAHVLPTLRCCLQALQTPPTPNKPYVWGKFRSILEQDNAGYTV